MSTTARTTAPAPAKKESGFKFGSATLILLGFVSWGAQFVAASTFGIAEYFIWDSRSTGGLIAVIAGIVMWVKCRSWESWRKWIWLPILISVTLAFIIMGSTAPSIAREDAEIHQEQEVRQEEEAANAKIAQACQDLSQQIEAKSDEIDASVDSRRRQAEAQADPSWDGPTWAGLDRPDPWEVADREEYDRLRAEYDASC